ncbi:cytochrome P450 [Rhodofomes roseus]|uniref:Cytochrome P450 n=1 Tax=Rhodofomes roseus TaxID=34475 RepID=A0ABQ8K9R3_9APHY|nr:cytochrome P450 [Rhodofomes roseus]KAH9834038.1 cytochrome P450 [Rhodofomes roseus]
MPGPLLPVVGFALVAHLWFKKYEPTDALSLSVLLGLFPAIPVLLTPLRLSSSTPLIVLAGYTSFYIALLLSIAIYRVSPLHPLYKYPGPLIGKLSSFHLVYVAARGKQHCYFRRMHAKYGRVVRLGPNVLSIVDVEMLPSILGVDGMPKGPMWDGRRISGKYGQIAAGIARGDLVGTRDKHIHAEARQLWSHGFTSASVRKYEPTIIRRVGQLVEALETQCSPIQGSTDTPVDMSIWLNFFTFDLMGDLVFGGPFDFLCNGDKDGMVRTIMDSLRLSSLTGHIPWSFKTLMKLPFLRSQTQGIGEFARQQVLRRLKNGPLHDDLLYHLNDEENIDNGPAPLPVLVTAAVAAIIAGSETTAFALSGVLCAIIAHPSCYERLQSEVDAIFPANNGLPADFAELANEALRLFPPIPTSLQRAPAPGSGGHYISPDMFIAEGIAVYVPPYAYHRDPQYFYPDPDAFRPERWLKSEDGATSGVLTPSAFMAFSAGPANCIARSLALMQMRIVLVSLLQVFDIHFPEGYSSEHWSDSLEDRFAMAQEALPVVLKRRL